MPKMKEFTIMEIYDSKDKQIFYAYAGENIKIRVKGIEDTEIKRGSIVCNTDDFCQATNEFQAEITIMELPEGKPILTEVIKKERHKFTPCRFIMFQNANITHQLSRDSLLLCISILPWRTLKSAKLRLIGITQPRLSRSVIFSVTEREE